MKTNNLTRIERVTDLVKHQRAQPHLGYCSLTDYFLTNIFYKLMCYDTLDNALFNIKPTYKLKYKSKLNLFYKKIC